MTEARTVVITGAGTGIGAACARLYAEEGAQLVLIGRRREPLEQVARETGGLILVGDAACPTTWDDFIRQIHAHAGRLDVLLACAGGHGLGSATQTSPATWEGALRSNLDSAFYSARACLPLLQASAGNIVLIGSIASLAAGPEVCGYTTAKHALLGLNRSLARDYGPHGVRVNAVCPGWVQTPMADAEMQPLMDTYGDTLQQAYDRVCADVPLRRAAQADEIAKVCRFLPPATRRSLPGRRWWRTVVRASSMCRHWPSPAWSPPMPNDLDFSGQVVLVTGGAQGIGLGIVEAFARRGAHVVIADRLLEQAQEVAAVFCAQGYSVEAVGVDLAEAEAVFTCIQALPQLDILVHNAGYFPLTPFEAITPAILQRTLAVNLSALFWLTQAALPMFRQQGRGCVLVTSSVTGNRVGYPGLSHYAASKAGVNGFIRNAALELAPLNVRVNGVEPGMIATPAMGNLGDAALNDSIASRVPLGRLGAAADIAGAMVFLASGLASYITGQTLVVDGGSTLPEV